MQGVGRGARGKPKRLRGKEEQVIPEGTCHRGFPALPPAGPAPPATCRCGDVGRGPRAIKVLGWPKRCTLAHAFLWEYSDKRLKLAQLLGQLGVFLTVGPICYG